MKRAAAVLIVVPLLAGSPDALRAAVEIPRDQIPMYGNIEKPQSVKLAEEQLIREAIATFGSREAASDAFALRAWQLYEEDDLAKAMRRFNEAWLLNPHNPQAYWGVGAILHDQGKVHEALAMLSRAEDLDPSNPRLMADLARVLAQEATFAATAAERERYFTRACELFQKASVLDPKNGHSYGLWALALYDRGRYAESWEKVHKAQALQEVIPEAFLRLLREKMPEPKRP
jgi:tetratricopeptide (TPR) repeat protein